MCLWTGILEGRSGALFILFLARVISLFVIVVAAAFIVFCIFAASAASDVGSVVDAAEETVCRGGKNVIVFGLRTVDLGRSLHRGRRRGLLVSLTRDLGIGPERESWSVQWRGSRRLWARSQRHARWAVGEIKTKAAPVFLFVSLSTSGQEQECLLRVSIHCIGAVVRRVQG